MKIKVSEKIDKYLDLARDIKKKVWNVRLAGILFVAGALRKISKCLEERPE